MAAQLESVAADVPPAIGCFGLRQNSGVWRCLSRDEVGVLRQVPLFACIAPARLKLLAFTSDRPLWCSGCTLKIRTFHMTRIALVHSSHADAASGGQH
ncbi:hypothetical protein FJW07_27420 [Mesorhizobium sp. B3-1-9]|nr:hypothetical protein FJW07_27420 [Mesorhizobium sp. B3-1-9]